MVDDGGIRDLRDMLPCRKGHTLLLAESGQKGLDLFRRECPDIIVLDLNMPEMDGLTVLQQIRGLDLHTPVIILTGTGTAEEEQQARALGITEFVEKGFSLHWPGDALKRLRTNPGPAT